MKRDEITDTHTLFQKAYERFWKKCRLNPDGSRSTIPREQPPYIENITLKITK